MWKPQSSIKETYNIIRIITSAICFQKFIDTGQRWVVEIVSKWTSAKIESATGRFTNWYSRNLSMLYRHPFCESYPLLLRINLRNSNFVKLAAFLVTLELIILSRIKSIPLSRLIKLSYWNKMSMCEKNADLVKLHNTKLYNES